MNTNPLPNHITMKEKGVNITSNDIGYKKIGGAP